ncbi:OmpA family protein [Salegentibacter sp. JZCK2]|uniref:OmpA family protein n=1 Tax=Salegentibacter tibetensis TaxID=2873600 RepID=UPI001CCB48C8|nr:OmpA family protein [Salegentibacter tibetensis]MBZ9729045.1 OmpA family protein [Salegentibacter tibetensis]
MTQSDLKSFLSTIADARRAKLNERESEQQKKYLTELRLKYQDRSDIRTGAYDNASYQQILKDLRYLNERINDLSANNTLLPSRSRDNSTILLPGNAIPNALNQPNERSTTTIIPSNNKTIKDLEERIDSLKNVELNKADYTKENSFADSLSIMKGNLDDVRRQMNSLESKIIAANKLTKTEDTGEDKTYFKQQVYFDNNSVTLKDEFYPYIQDLTQILIKYPEAKVLLEGWASPVGRVNYNKELSMRRAEAVEQAFINNRIDKTRIITSFRGEDKTSSEQFARRVDMSIIVR